MQIIKLWKLPKGNQKVFSVVRVVRSLVFCVMFCRSLFVLLFCFYIKFVSDLRQVGGFLRVLWFLPPIKLTATI